MEILIYGYDMPITSNNIQEWLRMGWKLLIGHDDMVNSCWTIFVMISNVLNIFIWSFWHKRDVDFTMAFAYLYERWFSSTYRILMFTEDSNFYTYGQNLTSTCKTYSDLISKRNKIDEVIKQDENVKLKCWSNQANAKLISEIFNLT